MEAFLFAFLFFPNFACVRQFCSFFSVEKHFCVHPGRPLNVCFTCWLAPQNWCHHVGDFCLRVDRLCRKRSRPPCPPTHDQVLCPWFVSPDTIHLCQICALPPLTSILHSHNLMAVSLFPSNIFLLHLPELELQYRGLKDKLKVN